MRTNIRKSLLTSLVLSILLASVFATNVFAASHTAPNYNQAKQGLFTYAPDPSVHRTAGTTDTKAAVSPFINLNPVCGGQKFGSGWNTYPTGGYVGNNCGAGIDYINSAYGASSYSLYSFGSTSGVAGLQYSLWAWIPTVKQYANANLIYSVYLCGTPAGTAGLNESQASGWTYLGTLTTGPDACAVQVVAYADSSSPGNLGLDAFVFDAGD